VPLSMPSDLPARRVSSAARMERGDGDLPAPSPAAPKEK
jgi:hypothetical protein